MKNRLFLYVLGLALGMSQAAYAQSTWNVASTIAGGGSETGTVGQWDAAPSDGESPMVLAGFWHAEEFPWLRIQRTGSAVLIAWPASFIGFQLEQSPTIAPAVWSSVSQSISVADGENQITLTLPPAMRFFRVRKP